MNWIESLRLLAGPLETAVALIALMGVIVLADGWFAGRRDDDSSRKR